MQKRKRQLQQHDFQLIAFWSRAINNAVLGPQLQRAEFLMKTTKQGQ